MRKRRSTPAAAYLGVRRMKITDRSSSLELEKTDDPEFRYMRITASLRTRSGAFSAENTGVLFGGGEAGKAELRRFKEFETNKVRVELTEGCWLEVSRLPRGNMEIDFQIAVIEGNSTTSLKSRLEVEGEHALEFLDALSHEIA